MPLKTIKQTTFLLLLLLQISPIHSPSTSRNLSSYDNNIKENTLNQTRPDFEDPTKKFGGFKPVLLIELFVNGSSGPDNNTMKKGWVDHWNMRGELSSTGQTQLYNSGLRLQQQYTLL